MGHLRLAHAPDDVRTLMGLRRSLRVAKVAQALDIDERQVRQLVRDGMLDGHRVGKRGIRVYEDSLDAYRRANHIGPRPPEPASEKKRQQRRTGPTAAAREAMAHLEKLGVF